MRSTVDMNTHGGQSWQHVLALLGSHIHTCFQSNPPPPPLQRCVRLLQPHLNLLKTSTHKTSNREVYEALSQTPFPLLGFVGEILLSACLPKQCTKTQGFGAFLKDGFKSFAYVCRGVKCQRKLLFTVRIPGSS